MQLSVPLDVGRSKRFHTRYQHIALTVRDKGCTAEGCDMPPDASTPNTERVGRRGRMALPANQDV